MAQTPMTGLRRVSYAVILDAVKSSVGWNINGATSKYSLLTFTIQYLCKDIVTACGGMTLNPVGLIISLTCIVIHDHTKHASNSYVSGITTETQGLPAVVVPHISSGQIF